jgi:hypothetical protein
LHTGQISQIHIIHILIKFSKCILEKHVLEKKLQMPIKKVFENLAKYVLDKYFIENTDFGRIFANTHNMRSRNFPPSGFSKSCPRKT